MKKPLAFVLVLMIVLSIFTVVPLYASAAEVNAAYTEAESGTAGDCIWKIEDNVLTISGSGKIPNYSIFSPDSIPWNGKSFTKVIIEKGVTRIGDCAFYGCTELTSIIIPDSIMGIGKEFFFRVFRINKYKYPGLSYKYRRLCVL
jgi:hypothetical protein